jgi:hypothetical protein
MRAVQGQICRLQFLQYVEPKERPLVLWIMKNPEQSQEALADLVRDIRDDPDRPFGCPCCPNARFQSRSKVEEHLRGQLEIRPFECTHWYVGLLKYQQVIDYKFRL